MNCTQAVKSLTFNGIVIESRAGDNYINATQMCKAGGREFKHWNSLRTTEQLIKMLGQNVGIPTFKLIDSKQGKSGGSWIHPDLAIQLAQWISPSFAIQVSRWIRELFTCGTVSIDSRKTDEELKALEQELFEKNRECERLEQEATSREAENAQKIALLERQKLMLDSYVKNIKSLEKNQIFYLATTVAYASQCRFEFGGVKDIKDLKPRLSSYNTGRAEGDLMYVTKLVKCNNYKLIEERLHVILKQFKDKPDSRKEMVRLRYDLLAEVVELVCDNFDREIDFINEKCQAYLQQTIYSEAIIPEPINLNDHVEITVNRAGVPAKTTVIDISDWSDVQIYAKIEEFIELCALEKRQMRYNLRSQKDIVPLELSWALLTPYMKCLRGLSLTDWRQKYREWYRQNRPTKLTIKGVRI